MVMDPRLRILSGSMNGLTFNDDPVSYQTIANRLKLDETTVDPTFMALPLLQPDPDSNNLAPASTLIPEEDSHEDLDFSDVVLKYISQMLMEEDMEDKACMFQESSALQAAEKPFYEILGEKYPPSPIQTPLYVGHNSESSDDPLTANFINYSSSSCCISCNNNTADTRWISDLSDCRTTWTGILLPGCTSQSTSPSSFSSSSSGASVLDGLLESPVSVVQVPDIISENESVWQFRRGVEEASKFLPNDNSLIIDLDNYASFPREPKEDAEVLVKIEQKDERENSPNGLRGKKNPHPEDTDLEERRSNKQSAVYTEETVRSEEFDRVLLCSGGRAGAPMPTLQEEALQNEANRNLHQNGHSKVSNSGKSRGKKQAGKKETVDLRTLLIHCAQFVAADDRKNACELLKQIRQHSSRTGDGNQRLANYFAEGLEARMAGTGSQIYTAFSTKRTSAADILKAYKLYLAACPFKKLSNFFSNRTILNLSEKATRLHIIDFGILYGFQWPCLIHQLSNRHGGPPNLRITGIELPQPGFRPTERVEETGRHLANYAERFGVPFQYNAIAQKWETIQIEDLKIEKDEMLVVNCLFRFRNLLDETVVVESPRNAILNLIRKMNPDIFVHGVVNGAYSAPFFVTRFREALFHFSSLFDMLDTNVPRENEERVVIEREMFGREALNVVACEGSERVERPETYKQWQVRTTRAGFKQLPLDREILKKAKDKVKSSYHKDFVIDEDSQWILQGWKGRIIYALSSWRPADGDS
ncbi:PREDICTED: scarecrow-like protein 14 [Nelumbo nucifera]|uniref:Scarecrow-like protein 14 n=1 Tax=Nelumbo nucifera TaxID=4432 RepID=A0A1U8AJ41_NELNU|nr:PREDICTED: scarecrow-like protein 14 [Nelumbo nucifera]